MFPDGLPGLALVLLRGSVGLTILHQGCAHYGALPVWLVAAMVLLAVLLAAGVFTPVLALAAIAVQLIGITGHGISGVDVVMVVASSLNALALAMLGPGAYSLDAHRFGRRVVDLPSAEDK
jgi:hypothetical protein